MRCELFFSGAQKNWSNIFWWTGAGSFPSNFDQDALAGAVQAALGPPMAQALSANFNLIGTYCVVNNGAGSFGVKHYAVIPGVDSAADPLPEDVAVVVQRISDTPGKSGRGRLYISGWTGGSANGSYLNDQGQTYGMNITTVLKAPIVNQGITWSPAVHSQKTNTLHAMVNALAVALLGTSRRRRATF
jgi:hypothetical protein